MHYRRFWQNSNTRSTSKISVNELQLFLGLWFFNCIRYLFRRTRNQFYFTICAVGSFWTSNWVECCLKLWLWLLSARWLHDRDWLFDFLLGFVSNFFLFLVWYQQLNMIWLILCSLLFWRSLSWLLQGNRAIEVGNDFEAWTGLYLFSFVRYRRMIFPW